MNLRRKLLIAMAAAMVCLADSGNAWENIPALPSGRRSEFYLLKDDGGYKYGFDTGLGSFAKQEADSANQVQGHFVYPNAGKLVDIKYTAGVEGYVPELAETGEHQIDDSATKTFPYAAAVSAANGASIGGDGSDGSYSFSYATDDSSRKEMGDVSGNVHGEYSFHDGLRTHDLSYKAGSDTGFIVTGGSLSTPLQPAIAEKTDHLTFDQKSLIAKPQLPSADASYSFAYGDDESKRTETSDASGTVRGHYSYKTELGQHDLSYEAGGEKGFVITGGSLSEPAGLTEPQLTKLKNIAPVAAVSAWDASSIETAPARAAPLPAAPAAGKPSGAFSFAYQTEHTAPAAPLDLGLKYDQNVFSDLGAHHIGHQIVSSILPAPIIHAAPAPIWSSPKIHSPIASDESGAANKEYTFAYGNDGNSRSESSDSSGNVKGSYSYKTALGDHDLTYEAGPEKGFVITGGSLSEPAGLTEPQLTKLKNIAPVAPVSAWDASSIETAPARAAPLPAAPAAGKPSGAFSFAYQTEHTAPAAPLDLGLKYDQNVFSDLGAHHIGHQIVSSILPAPIIHAAPAPIWSSPKIHSPIASDESGAANKEYTFAYGNDGNSRSESSDSSGNVKGSYSYKTALGDHDLTYEAGPEKGFVVTGGSLASPSGLTETQKVSLQRISPIVAEPAPTPASAAATGSVWSSAVKSHAASIDTAPWSPAKAAHESFTAETGATKSSDVGSSDSAYSFAYGTDLSSHQQSSDASGNVKGSYKYSSNLGEHDLTYEVGADTGFVVTGGSLAEPAGLSPHQLDKLKTIPAAPIATTLSNEYLPPLSSHLKSTTAEQVSAPASGDTSYSFAYDTGNSGRTESGDHKGNVQGSYHYKSGLGTHDLSYKADANTGFTVTGGSLASPAGLAAPQHLTLLKGQAFIAAPVVESSFAGYKGFEGPTITDDGQYKFDYASDNHARTEVGDGGGHVLGRYAYVDQSGTHDLSYASSPDTGYIVTGGNLATPNVPALKSSIPTDSWTHKIKYDTPKIDDTDKSYAFAYTTDDSSREESGDGMGNVRGRFSYMNDAGNHDLSFVAGADTGFVVTGGSLAAPTGPQSDVDVPVSKVWTDALKELPNVDHSSVGELRDDGSYSFAYLGDTSSREESGDTAGNVRGSYSYVNEEGHHDLTYKAGDSTGFVVTGGTLAKTLSADNSAPERVHDSGKWSADVHHTRTQLASDKSTGAGLRSSLKYGEKINPIVYTAGGNVLVHKYLAPENVPKVGYIFDTIH